MRLTLRGVCGCVLVSCDVSAACNDVQPRCRCCVFVRPARAPACVWRLAVACVTGERCRLHIRQPCRHDLHTQWVVLGDGAGLRVRWQPGQFAARVVFVAQVRGQGGTTGVPAIHDCGCAMSTVPGTCVLRLYHVPCVSHVVRAGCVRACVAVCVSRCIALFALFTATCAFVVPVWHGSTTIHRG